METLLNQLWMRSCRGLENMPPASMLSLHLGWWNQCLQSFPLVLQHARAGSLPWSQNLLPEAQKLAAKMAAAPLAAMVAAAQKQAANEAIDFLEGLLAFGEYEKSVPHHEMSGQSCWSRGAARLLEYMPSGAVTHAALLVPSLINRANLLDLMPSQSFARYLADNGVHCFLLDWGVPGEFEKNMGIEDYIDALLVPAIERASRISGSRISLIGYCMGGLLAMAAAQKNKGGNIANLSLLATPWDFHSDGSHAIKLDAEALTMLKLWIGQMGELPAWFLQPMFYRADPWMFTRKYKKFPELPAIEKDIFTTVERWLNNGVALVPKVAETCLIDWSHGNHTMLGKWFYGGEAVNPARLKMPVMAVVPSRDRVVPPSSIAPLLAMLPEIKILRPDTGHVGIVINKDAPANIWQPLLDWMKK